MGLLPLEQIFIGGDLQGLHKDVKPYALTDQAFSALFNAYAFRGRVVKRKGLKLLGRLRRILTAVTGGNSFNTAISLTFNLFQLTGVDLTQPNAELELPGTTAITLLVNFTGQTITPNTNNDGTTTITGAGLITSAFINFATGDVTLTVSGNFSSTVTQTLAYYPGLPVMGIISREKSTINDEETIFFDTQYTYTNPGTGFQDYSLSAEWRGADWNLFWGANYRGVTPDVKILFVTNFVNDALNPIRYTSGGAWTDFAPLVDATHTLFQAKIIIPYYGRLLALNVYEGTTGGGYAAALNIFNRCRFSQVGDPLDVSAWRSDLFGKGGFIDAPTGEAIISATFYKNTLIVNFERSTWQLRYVGEYGIPFLWERISSDFGSESTFSSVVFDAGVMTVGDKAITACSAVGVERVDEDIPDEVFGFKNDNNGIDRVSGVRDFFKELTYWNFVNSQDVVADQVFPNQVLVFNYRNGTWAKFDDRVTCFGTYQPVNGITWGRTDIFWGDANIYWRDPANQSKFPAIVAGNSQGYVHYFNTDIPDTPSYSIHAVTLTATLITLTIPNNTLVTDDIIGLTGLTFVDGTTFAPLTTDLNNNLYKVNQVTSTTATISKWNGTNYVTDFSFTPVTTALYIGGGQLTFFPKMEIDTKDFNPYQARGMQMKVSYIDLLTDATPLSAISVQLFVNSYLSLISNVIVGNTQLEQSSSPFGKVTNATQANPCVITSANHGLRTGQSVNITNVQGMTNINLTFTVTYIDANTFSINVDSTGFPAYTGGGNWASQSRSYFTPSPQTDEEQYMWHRFYATCNGQYIRLRFTYDDNLMNNPETHANDFELNAMSLWTRPGSRNIF